MSPLVEMRSRDKKVTWVPLLAVLMPIWISFGLSMHRVQDVRSNLESLQLFMRQTNSNINQIGIQPARPIPLILHAAVPEQLPANGHKW